MKKSLGVCSAIFPMPVLMIGTYNEDGSIDVMNAAWGMMLDTNKVVLNLDESHKTVENIKNRGAFTVAIADVDHMKEADYLGIVSCNVVKNKFEKSGLSAVKSDSIDAPVINEFPVTMECKFLEFQDDDNGCGVVGEIVNVLADEGVLVDGIIDASRINALMYDPFNHNYFKVGEKVGKAFSEGRSLR